MQLALITRGTSLTAGAFGIAFAGVSDVAPPAQRSTVPGIVTDVYGMGRVIALIVIGHLAGANADAAVGSNRGLPHAL